MVLKLEMDRCWKHYSDRRVVSKFCSSFLPVMKDTLEKSPVSSMWTTGPSVISWINSRRVAFYVADRQGEHACFRSILVARS